MDTAIVAFAFGTPSNIPANVKLAQVAKEFAVHGDPIWTQSHIEIHNHDNLWRVREQPGHPPTTLNIAEQVIKQATILKVKTLIVVAAAPHRWRCARDLQRVAKDRGITIVITPAEFEPGFKWFSTSSSQSRTTSWFRWWPRELILQHLSWKRYKRVAR